MEISLTSYEVMKAIAVYVKKQYGLNISGDTMEIDDVPLIKWTEYNTVYETTKNGSLKKKDGHLIVNREESSFDTRYTPFDDDAFFEIYITPKVKQQQ